MLLITHITVALLSILLTSYTLLRPSRTKLHGCYALAAATLGTGTFLVISAQTGIVRACITGITYFALVSIGIVFIKRKVNLSATH